MLSHLKFICWSALVALVFGVVLGSLGLWLYLVRVAVAS